MECNIKKSKEWLYQQYVVGKRSANDISKELNVADTTIKKWLIAYGIKPRTLKESRMPNNKNYDLINDISYIKKLYIEGELTCKEIADKLSCGTQTIYRRLKDGDVEISTFEKRMLNKNPKLKKLRSKNWMYQRYITEDKTIVEIANEIGTSPTMVSDWLDKHCISTKDWHETHGNKYSDEQLEEMFRNVGNKINKIPSAKDLNEFCEKGICPHSATYRLRGGLPYWQKKVFGKSLRKWREWEYDCITLFNKVLGYPEFKREKRFNWLKSPTTNYYLRVDVFYPEYKLCVEFDGIGHFKPIQFISGQDAEQQFERTKLNDATKNKLIPQNGLKLLRFKYDEPLTEEYVKERLKEFVDSI